MKKVLSIILIAAAAFGFYGGAVDITDVLDSKDYWEEQGKITDENLDKLEDGVNKLEENAEAYLDGKAQYEDGQAQLADAKQQYADGVAQIADTEDQYGGPGVPTLKAVKENVDKLLDTKGSLDKAAAVVAANSGGLVTAASAKTLYNSVNTLMKGYSEKDAIAVVAKKAGADVSQITKIYNGVKAYVAAGLSEEKAVQAVAEAAVLAELTPVLKMAYEGMDMLVSCNGNIDKAAAVAAKQSLPDGSKEEIEALTAQIKTIYTSVDGLIKAGATKDQAIAQVAAATVAQQLNAQGIAIDAATVGNIVAAVAAAGDNDDILNAALGGLIDAATARQIAAGYAKAVTDITKAYDGALFLMGMTPALAAETILTEYADLVKDYADKINVATVVTVYETVKLIVSMGAPVDTAIEEVAKKVAEPLITSTAADISAAYSGIKMLVNGMTLDQACATAGAEVGVDGKVIKTLYQNVAMFVKGLSWDEAIAIVANAAGKTPELIEKAYNGYGDYLEGKQKLAAAPAQIAEGEAKLADAASQLGEYEDGMETLKDGLKTLMEAKAEGGLKSIAARIGEGEDFLDEDGFIDFEKALFGVEQGRAYSADSGEAITPELTNRAIAAGVGLGASLFALIGAVLALAKKKKGAGVCGILAAAAGAAAVVMTNAAGDTWTVLAGSTIGTMPVIAFGVVAAAALIFGIAQFGGKEA